MMKNEIDHRMGSVDLSIEKERDKLIKAAREEIKTSVLLREFVGWYNRNNKHSTIGDGAIEKYVSRHDEP